jgi:hypothetical protein
MAVDPLFRSGSHHGFLQLLKGADLDLAHPLTANAIVTG